MNDLLIRKATANDIEALRGLYLALEEDGVRYQPEHFVIGERTDEFFQNIFDSDNQDILVADIDGLLKTMAKNIKLTLSARRYFREMSTECVSMSATVLVK